MVGLLAMFLLAQTQPQTITKPGATAPAVVSVQGNVSSTPLLVTVTNGGSGGTASSFGATFPSAGTAAGVYASSTGLMTYLKVAADGALYTTSTGGASGGGGGSVTQGTVPWVVTSTIQTVTGTVAVGTHAVTQSGGPWSVTTTGFSFLGGALIVTSTNPGGGGSGGSVTQGTSPWVVSSTGPLGVWISNPQPWIVSSTNPGGGGSGGSVTQGTVPWVVTSTVQSVTGTVAVSGNVGVLQATIPWTVSSSNPLGVIVTNVVSVTHTAVTIGSGTVAATQSGTWVTSSTPLGLATATTPGSCVSVTTASTALLASNTGRRHANWISLDTNTARVRFRLGTPATTSDLPLSIGQSFDLSDSSNAIYTGTVTAISESGTQTVCVGEW